MSQATELADWAIGSPLVDGVLFSPDGNAPICALASARGFRGFGKGNTQGEALGSALGEAMEQYAAAQVPSNRLIRASYADLHGRAFDPRWLCLYSEEQYQRPGFPWLPFDENQPRHWVSGYWMENGREVFLPAFAVWLSDRFEPEALCQMTSNGLGAGRTLEDAARRAALELRERDAFVTSWLSCTGAVRVPDTRGDRFETYLVAPGDPAFVAVSVGLGDGWREPAVTLGLGAGETADQAIARALLEHGQTAPSLTEIWKKGETPIPASHDEVRTLQDHALYYCCPSHRGEFDDWRNKATAAPPPRKRARSRIAIADLTPPELMESPFRVARALAQGLQPIHYGYGFERKYTDELSARLAGRPGRTAPLPIY